MPLCDILLNTLPRYETKIPSTKEEVWFRPLLVKEERLLLQISEFGTLLHSDFGVILLFGVQNYFGFRTDDLCSRAILSEN